jgi:hypothetical protein
VFSGDTQLPKNVGVGDAITIGRQTFHILSRDSSTQVTLQETANSSYFSKSYSIRRAYNTLQAWESGRGGNLVNENRREVGVAYDDGPFRSKLEIADSTTDSEHYMMLTVAEGQRHQGVRGTGAIIDAGGGFGDEVIGVKDPYTRIEWLEITNFRDHNKGVDFDNYPSYDRGDHSSLSNLLIYRFDTGNSKAAIFIRSDNITVRNTIIFDGKKDGIRVRKGSARIENCTFYGLVGDGVREINDSTSVEIRNTISVGNGSQDFDLEGGVSYFGYNMYGTTQDFNPKGHQGHNQAPPSNFGRLFRAVAPGLEDLHLKASGHSALGTGLNLANSFVRDIDGESRSAPWELGADDVGSSVPACGDGITSGSEHCDGSDDDLCPGACEADCTCGPFCGDGVKDSAEQCDGSSDAACPGACQSNCTCGAFCGDGVANGSEQCDGPSDAACPGACQSNCTCGAFCGDGVANGSEQCDGPSDAACPGACQSNCSCGAFCGDGVANGSEQCDGSSDAACPGDCLVDCTCGGDTSPADVSVHYRSIGRNSGVLYSTGQASVATGSKVVTFSQGASLPNHAGLGDRLVIGSETLFILSRDSSTRVTVQAPATRGHSYEPYTIHRAYNEMQQWESDRGGNLVAENRREVGVAYNDGPFNAKLEFSGSTTDSRHYMMLTVAEGQRHRGVAGTGALIDALGGVRDEVIGIKDPYTRIEWLEITNFHDANKGLDFDNYPDEDKSDNSRVSNLLVHDFYVGNSKAAIYTRGDNITIRNTIIANGSKDGIRVRAGSATIENCTVYGVLGDGIRVINDNASVVIRNTISLGSGSQDFDLEGGIAYFGYNMYGTTQDFNPSSHQGHNQSPPSNPDNLFVSIVPGAENLHLETRGHNAHGAALDLSAFFAYDVDGELRETPWDIGADNTPCAGCVAPFCGDGVTNNSEQCDRGDDAVCPGTCQANCTCGQSCGDGVTNGSEQCDGADDGACPGSCLADCSCGAFCGDGLTNGSEECDGADDAACPSTCRADCTCGAFCGDGVTNGFEQCDGVDDAACPGHCSPDCSCDPFCGDGVVNGSEQCDGTSDVLCPGACLLDCSCASTGPACGDGVEEGSEECDGPDDGACPGACLSNCTCGSSGALCGDGVTEGSEECDGLDDLACPGLCLPSCSCGGGSGSGVDLTVKDSSGYGIVDYPVTAVIPLEYGRFETIASFRIRSATGAPVPAQFEVLNRWWARDNSLRHVVAHFQATVPSGSERHFTFHTNGGSTATHSNAVVVADLSNAVTVDTGRVRFTVRKTAFNLFDEVYFDTNGDGTYSASERIIASGAGEGPVFTGRLSGDIQRARDRANTRVVIEEAGPMRAVLRVSSVGSFQSTSDHDHGFALRIYAYAGQSFVKVDYQLQNSARNVRFSWPLYFEDVSLKLKPALSSPTLRFGLRDGHVWQGNTGSSGRYLFQSSLDQVLVRDSGSNAGLDSAVVTPGNSSFGWTDVSDASRGVAIVVRHMAEMWPNGVEVASNNEVAVRLWPRWSAQRDGAGISSSGLYWLDDMQQVVKESLFYFHGPGVSNGQLEAMALNFQYHPLAVVPLDEYRRTSVTLDLDGVIPAAVDPPGQDTRRVAEPTADRLNPAHSRYAFGWADFWGDTGRKKSNNTGSWPDSGAQYIASGRIDHFFEAERRMWGDLNTRPMWIAEYDHDDDFARLAPSVNPYGGKSWRAFDGHGVDPIAAPYLSGTVWGGWHPRDNEHGWFYHIDEFYLSSANPWIRDWYEFIGEFRKRTLFRGTSDPVGGDYFEWNWGTRGEAHMLANSLQAYRATGDAQLLNGLRQRIDWLRTSRLDEFYGVVNPDGEAAFQQGFMARALEGYVTELHQGDSEYEAKAFMTLWGVMEWHIHHSQYSYYKGVDTGPAASSGSGLSMPDPTAVWYLWTGHTQHLQPMFNYVSSGLNGGSDPYGDWPTWGGQWEARAFSAVDLHRKPSDTSAAPILNLQATYTGSKVRLQWTAPVGAARYIVVWSTYPISRTYTQNQGMRNFWSANVVATDLMPDAGRTQTLEFGGVPRGTTIYASIVTLTADRNLSEPSNAASVFVP